MRSAFRLVLSRISSHLSNFFHSKRMLIFIGDFRTYIAVYNGDKLTDSLSITGGDYEITPHEAFFSKYKKYSVSIIIDRAESNLYHAQIPVAQSLLPTDNIGRFITKTLDKADIVASNVYYVVNDSAGETWHTTLTHIKEIPILSKVLPYVSLNFPNFRGIYFLTINIPNL